MTDEEMEQQHRQIHEVLSMLREQYALACKPYLQMLINLEAMRPPRYIVTLEQGGEDSFPIH